MMTNTNTAAIESLRSFASEQCTFASKAHYEHMTEFVNMCTAALAGEEWALERVHGTFAMMGAETFAQYRSRATEEIEEIALACIRATNATRPLD